MTEVKQYTIKMLADELGISKQAVRKKVSTIDSKLVSTADDGKTILISSKGAEILRKGFKDKVSTKVSTVGGNVDINLVDTQQERIKELKEQIEFLKEQIKIKDEQIQTQQREFNDLKFLYSNKQLLIEEKKESKVKGWFKGLFN